MYRVHVTRVEPTSYEVIRREVYRGLEELSAAEVVRGRRVFVKPNLCIPQHWSRGSVTNPLVVRAVVEYCLDHGAREVTVGDASIVGFRASKVFEVAEYRKYLSDLGVELVDLDDDSTRVLEVPRGKVLRRVEVAETPLQHDVLINVPVMKTHVITKVTLSLKNVKGLLPARSKRVLHVLGLEQAIADLNTVLRSDLVVMDGTVAHEGLGPVSGEPVNLGLLLFSRNPVAVDMVAAEIMGFRYQEIEHIVYAIEHGLGPRDLSEVSVTGYRVEEVRRPFRRATLVQSFPEVEIISGEPCSGCESVLLLALKRLHERGVLREFEEKYGKLVVVIGPRAEVPEGVPPERVLVVGTCLAKLREKVRYYVPGCPPIGFVIQDVVRAMLEGREVPELREEVEKAKSFGTPYRT